MISKLSALALGLFLVGCNETPKHGDHDHDHPHHEEGKGQDGDEGHAEDHDGKADHDEDGAAEQVARAEVRYYLISEA